MGHFFIIMITIILTSSEGVPHMATNDDEYNGYYIPKGTVVIGNGWSVYDSVRTLSLTLCTGFSI